MAAKTGLSGEYKGQKLRSFPEYVFAVYLDKVLGVEFVTEPFALQSPYCNKRKIPDFRYTNPKSGLDTLVEVKDNHDELIRTIEEYANYGFRLGTTYHYEFVHLTGGITNPIVVKICEVIGKDIWLEMSAAYKAEARVNKKVYGFVGAANPNYGKKHSPKTRNKISTALKKKYANGNSPNFGRKLSPATKKKIGAKWYDENKKLTMKKKGMLTHISKFSDEQFEEYTKYCEDRLNGLSHKPPKFLNRAYFVNKDKILELFNSVKEFKKAIRKARCDKN